MKVLHLLLDPALSSVLTNLTLLSQLLLPFGAVPVLYDVTSEFVSNIEINIKKNKFLVSTKAYRSLPSREGLTQSHWHHRENV